VVGGELHTLDALPLAEEPQIHIRSWVSPIARLDAVKKREISFLHQKSNPVSLVIHLTTYSLY
jgi:hypothetical protein